jgi:hypothetical protein
MFEFSCHPWPFPEFFSCLRYGTFRSY